MPIGKGAALAYFEELFKGRLAVQEFDLAPGIAPIPAIQSDAERLVLTFVNLGPTVLYIAPSVTVTIAHGILLEPNGGSLTLNVTQDALLPTLLWYVVGNGANGVMYILSVHRAAKLPEETA